MFFSCCFYCYCCLWHNKKCVNHIHLQVSGASTTDIKQLLLLVSNLVTCTKAGHLLWNEYFWAPWQSQHCGRVVISCHTNNDQANNNLLRRKQMVNTLSCRYAAVPRVCLTQIVPGVRIRATGETCCVDIDRCMPSRR